MCADRALPDGHATVVHVAALVEIWTRHAVIEAPPLLNGAFQRTVATPLPAVELSPPGCDGSVAAKMVACAVAAVSGTSAMGEPVDSAAAGASAGAGPSADAGSSVGASLVADSSAGITSVVVVPDSVVVGSSVVATSVVDTPPAVGPLVDVVAGAPLASTVVVGPVVVDSSPPLPEATVDVVVDVDVLVVVAPSISPWSAATEPMRGIAVSNATSGITATFDVLIRGFDTLVRGRSIVIRSLALGGSSSNRRQLVTEP